MGLWSRLRSSTWCCEKYPTFKFFPSNLLPSKSGNSPLRLFTKVDFPAPLTPNKPILSPGRSDILTLLMIEVSYPRWASSRVISGFEILLVSGILNLNGESICAGAINSILSNALIRL